MNLSIHTDKKISMHWEFIQFFKCYKQAKMQPLLVHSAAEGTTARKLGLNRPIND